MLQCVAVCRSLIQCVAVCYSLSVFFELSNVDARDYGEIKACVCVCAFESVCVCVFVCV